MMDVLWLFMVDDSWLVHAIVTAGDGLVSASITEVTITLYTL